VPSSLHSIIFPCTRSASKSIARLRARQVPSKRGIPACTMPAFLELFGAHRDKVAYPLSAAVLYWILRRNVSHCILHAEADKPMKRRAGTGTRGVACSTPEKAGTPCDGGHGTAAIGQRPWDAWGEGGSSRVPLSYFVHCPSSRPRSARELYPLWLETSSIDSRLGYLMPLVAARHLER